ADEAQKALLQLSQLPESARLGRTQISDGILLAARGDLLEARRRLLEAEVPSDGTHQLRAVWLATIELALGASHLAYQRLAAWEEAGAAPLRLAEGLWVRALAAPDLDSARAADAKLTERVKLSGSDRYGALLAEVRANLLLRQGDANGARVQLSGATGVYDPKGPWAIRCRVADAALGAAEGAPEAALGYVA